MASENRPGVIVTQALSETTAVTASPALVPCVMAPCFQIIEAVNDDGSVNATARHSSRYNQTTTTITQAQFPDPRSNLDEIEIYEDQVDIQLFKFSGLEQLQRGSNGTTGSSFLQRISSIYRPAIIFDGCVAGSGSITFSSEERLVMSIDVANSASQQKDITYVFPVTVTTAEEVAAVFNNGFGDTIAFVTATHQVVVFSPTYGPAGSITLRGGSSALSTLDSGTFLDNSGVAISGDIRVEGSGLAAQDDEDGDLTSPYIEYSRGIAKFSASAYSTSFTETAAWPSWAGFNNGTSDTPSLLATQAAAVTFTGSSPTIPLKAATASTPGDYLVVDGIRLGGAEVTLVESTRFKLGTINTSTSTYSASTGELVTRIYDSLEVNITAASLPFSPQFAYFVAQNLEFGAITPAGEAATISGSADNILAAKQARISALISNAQLQAGGSILMTGLNLVIQETIAGVQGAEVQIDFTDTMTAVQIAAALTADEDLACTAAVVEHGSNKYFVISSGAAGADEIVSVKATGNLNDALGFSQSSATTGSGRDFECASVASFSTEDFLATDSSVETAAISLNITDADGTSYALSTTLSASGLGNVDAVATAISSALGTGDGNLLYNGIPVAKVAASTGEGALPTGSLVFSTIDGGSNASISWGVTAEPAIGAYSASFKKTTFVFDDITALTSFSFDDANGSVVNLSGLSLTSYADLQALVEAEATFPYAKYTSVVDGNSLVVFHKDLALQAQFQNVTAVGATLTPVTPAYASMPDLDADGTNLLKDLKLDFYIDDNPFKYESGLFDSNSVPAAVDAINIIVGGDSDIASSDSSTGAMTLTSSTVGAASKLELAGSSTADGAANLDFSATSDDGAGRPNPDFYIDASTNAVILGANILRNSSTGIPYSIESAFADIYIEYKALRKDVTASASSPGLVTFGSIVELEASIGPISAENPLALGTYLAMLNSPLATVSCLGIDETTPAAPLGTVDAYLRGLELLESKEVYAIAPMTSDNFIQQLISTHVQALSQPSERGERIALFWKPTPDRAGDSSIEGGAGDATQNGSDNQLRLASNPSSEIISAGITDLTSIAVSSGLYLEVTTVALGSTQVANYSVSAQNGITSTLRTSFSSGENDDGFYSETPFSGTDSFASISYALRTRGAKLLITGTTLPDVTKITEAAAAQAAGFDHRRVYLLFGDSVDVSLSGVTTNVPGYYIAAGLAGMIGSQDPQQPFTNLVMTGYGKVYGTDDTYSENQLDVIADGGRYVLKNLGGGTASRHQRSTTNLTLESRELSITKAIDFLAKGLREINRVFIGKFVITPGFLDQLTMANEGYLRRVVQLGVVRSSSLKSLLQSEAAPDTVLIEVEVQPAYPCNKIRITIVS